MDENITLTLSLNLHPNPNPNPTPIKVTDEDPKVNGDSDHQAPASPAADPGSRVAGNVVSVMCSAGDHASAKRGSQVTLTLALALTLSVTLTLTP